MAHLDAKLLEWSEVQEQIQHLLKNSDPGEETSVLLPHGLQPSYSLHHPHVIRCLAFYNSTKGDVFVTHVDAGHRNEMFVWTISKLSQEQVKCARFSINPSISKLLYVPQHRVFVGFCKDIRLCIFSDIIHHCSELSSITCATTVLCMVYNELTDELVTGGHGSLQAWNMSHVEIREPLSSATGFECDLTSTDWVRDVRIDVKYKMLIALCDERVLLINSENRKQIYNFPNWHQTALTSFVFYRKFEYLITASMDGCIKVWNAVVYGQVHEFVGHFDCVTGLIVHPSDPLLFSSSKDGSVRVWRLDTLELTYRLDYGESILGMRLANHHQIFFYTQHKVKGYNFNQFHHLFTPVQSRVHLLSRIKSSVLPSRILCAAEDGGVRVISPVSGSILTIIYPMATYQVLTDIVYDISRARIYTVLTTGDVLLFSSNTNPCTSSQLWVPDTQDDSIICITLMKLDCALGRNEHVTSESFVFAGSRSGQIHLIESSTITMQLPVQAHCGTVMHLQSSHGDYGKGQNCIEGADRLVSSGSDKTVRIWKLEINQMFVSLTCMIAVTSNNCACHLSMISNTLCMTMPNFEVHVYDLSQGSMNNSGSRHQTPMEGRHNVAEEQSYRLCTHHKDNDHTQQITALCSCHSLGIFATTSDDGLVKIWDRANELVRELTFDETLRGVCFANDRGDLLVGFQNHISLVNIASYLPLTYLENIVDQHFPSDTNEEPIPFDHNLQLWFDIDSILALPMELVKRKRTLLKLENIGRASLQAVKQPVTTKEVMDCQPIHSQVNITDVESEIISTQEKVESSITGIKPVRYFNTVNARFLPKFTHCSPRASNEECVIELSEETDHHPCISSSSVEEVRKTPYEKTEDVDRGTEAKHKWPIAPDGYIPNSIIRKYMRLQPEPEKVAESPWRLKSLPFIRSPDSIGHASNSSEEYVSHAPISWMSSSESNEELDEEDILVMLSDEVTNNLVLDTDELLSLTSDSETEMLTPEEILLKRKRKTAAALIKNRNISKKFPSTDMGKKMTMDMYIQEAMKKKDEEKKKMSDIMIERKHSEIPEILKLIVRMRWFSPKKLKINIFSVTNALVALLDKVDDSIHGHVCKCILDIHYEIGLNDFLMDKVLNNLLKQVHGDRIKVKCNAVRTMADLGDNRTKVVLGILPLVIDPIIEVKVEATEALKKLNGLCNREQLLKYLASIGILKTYVNEDKNILYTVFRRDPQAAFRIFSKIPDRKLPKELAVLQPPSIKVDHWLSTATETTQPEVDSSVLDRKSSKVIDLPYQNLEEKLHYPLKESLRESLGEPKESNLKSVSRAIEKFKKLPVIKKTEEQSQGTFFVPDSCFGQVDNTRKKASPTVRRETMHAEIVEAKKYSLYLEKMKMEMNMQQHLKIHRKRYEKMLRKQRKAKPTISKLLPTNINFYKYYFGNARKYEILQQPTVKPTNASSDFALLKYATLPHINELEESMSSQNMNPQFSVVLDKGAPKHLELESGIEDALTCSKLSLTGSQRIGTQYSSGFFSSQTLEDSTRSKSIRPNDAKKTVFKTEIKVLKGLKKIPPIPVFEPSATNHHVIYSADKLPLERTVFPLRMTNKIAIKKFPNESTMDDWDIKRSKGTSTFGVLEMSWALVKSKEDVSDKHRTQMEQQKNISFRTG